MKQRTEGFLHRTVGFTDSERGAPVGFAEAGAQGLDLLWEGMPRAPVLRTEFRVPDWGREVPECSVQCW